jgi:hypothetical protein
MNDIRERVRLFVGERPLLLRSFYRLRPEKGKLLVGRKTQLVIEGFPRSGNTFAVIAFEQAQKESISIAHHLHMPAQVAEAVRLRIPILVLIRHPKDAVLSLVLRERRISIRRALNHYVSFYETVFEHRDACVVAPFAEVVTDYGAVIERVNARFGTRFSPFRHTEDNVDRVFAQIEDFDAARGGIIESKISRPSAARNELKEALRKKLELPKVKPLFGRAKAAYDDFILPE